MFARRAVFIGGGYMKSESEGGQLCSPVQVQLTPTQSIVLATGLPEKAHRMEGEHVALKVCSIAIFMDREVLLGARA